jgi:hypothetical protein
MNGLWLKIRKMQENEAKTHLEKKETDEKS